jgi:hypothetical protein
MRSRFDLGALEDLRYCLFVLPRVYSVATHRHGCGGPDLFTSIKDMAMNRPIKWDATRIAECITPWPVKEKRETTAVLAGGPRKTWIQEP